MQKHVIVVGSSGSGKSFLIREATLRLKNSIHIAKRVTTREKRLNEANEEENVFVSEKEFLRLVDEGRFFFHWAKEFPDRSRLLYGILPPQEAGLIVYPANNHLLLSSPALLPETVRTNMTVIQIVANIDTRIDRILNRRPPLSAKESAYRVCDISNQDCMRIKPHIVITNDRLVEASARDLFVTVLSALGD